jgi:hypothetical protein
MSEEPSSTWAPSQKECSCFGTIIACQGNMRLTYRTDRHQRSQLCPTPVYLLFSSCERTADALSETMEVDYSRVGHAGFQVQIHQVVRSHVERRCCNLGQTQSRISPSVLYHTKIDSPGSPKSRARRDGTGAIAVEQTRHIQNSHD